MPPYPHGTRHVKGTVQQRVESKEKLQASREEVPYNAN